MKKSSKKTESENPHVPPPMESDEELRKRQRQMRIDDWKDNAAYNWCGVREKYKDARLQDFEDPEAFAFPVFKHSWLYAWGPVGTGKTHLLCAMVHWLYVKGFDVQRYYVPDFIKSLWASFKSRDVLTADLIYRLETVQVLALDDLGTERLHDTNVEALTGIINYRYEKNLRTMISSNYDLENLAKRYERIADRIREKATVVELDERRPERG